MLGALKCAILHSSPRPRHVFMQASSRQDLVMFSCRPLEEVECKLQAVVLSLRHIALHYVVHCVTLRYIKLVLATLH